MSASTIGSVRHRFSAGTCTKGIEFHHRLDKSSLWRSFFPALEKCAEVSPCPKLVYVWGFHFFLVNFRLCRRHQWVLRQILPLPAAQQTSEFVFLLTRRLWPVLQKISSLTPVNFQLWSFFGVPSGAASVVPPVDSSDLVSYLVLETSFLAAKEFKARKV